MRPEVIVICHPPDKHNTRAFGKYDEVKDLKPYLVRDKDMVDASSFLWACPDGLEKLRSGTWATVRYARNQGTLITIIYPDGEIVYE